LIIFSTVIAVSYFKTVLKVETPRSGSLVGTLWRSAHGEELVTKAIG
jgi:hypothetical protein